MEKQNDKMQELQSELFNYDITLEPVMVEEITGTPLSALWLTLPNGKVYTILAHRSYTTDDPVEFEVT